MAEVVPHSPTICVIGGGFHPVVVFGSIWRRLWSGAQCLCQDRRQSLLQRDPRELSLHEIEFVYDHREVGARLIEVIQFLRVLVCRAHVMKNYSIAD